MNKLLDLLNEYGEDAGSDLNDGIGGYFEWRIITKEGITYLKVTLEEFPPDEDVDDTDGADLGEPDLVVTEKTWILTPL